MGCGEAVGFEDMIELRNLRVLGGHGEASS